MIPGESRSWWRYLRTMAAPIMLWLIVILAIREPLTSWLRGEDSYDQDALTEWLDEARGFRETLPEMVESYQARARRAAELKSMPRPADRDPARWSFEQHDAENSMTVKREEITEHLRSLGDPTTKVYGGQLPLFPIIYSLQVRLDDEPDNPITWDSGLPSHPSQYRELPHRIHPRATVYIRYQLHAYNKRQRIEQEHNARLSQLMALAAFATIIGLIWMVIIAHREQERDRERVRVQEQVAEAERSLLVEERRHAETEKQLLEQRLEAARHEGRAAAAEHQALELKSQLYASIGIMAGSYAHNIKNLLVRPNDLLRRCLEVAGISTDQEQMLHEVQQTLGTVTERLQQILRTVRRDPSRSEQGRVDVNALMRDLDHTWHDLAREKWKLDLDLDLEGGALNVAGDLSHLQQAVENLLFNARDATFEMRNHLRDEARSAADNDPNQRRQRLIAAAAWRGHVSLRSRREGTFVILEVTDNGIGMSNEVRQRCTETHYSTKRDNAIYEGNSTGMGLGLSFVVAILEHHDAKLEIASEPLRGTTFRIRFPGDGDS